MPRPLLLAAVLAATALTACAGCDFQPTLDIETPAFDGGLTLNTVLFADSTVQLRISRARDPYGTQTTSTGSFGFAPVNDATVTISRDGSPPEPLPFVSRTCTGGDPRTGEPVGGECGRYESATPILAGTAVVIRAEAPGTPPAEARVRVPERAAVTATVEPGPVRENLPTDRVTLRIQDAPGLGQWYGLDVLQSFAYTGTGTFCDPAGCRDSTFTSGYTGQTSFTTADPILLAGLRGIPGTNTFVTFSDRLFDGQERAFTIESLRYPTTENQTASRRTVRVIAFDRPIVEAYEQAYFSLGEENPFQQPTDPVSNVSGGYGLVGAAAITEIGLP